MAIKPETEFPGKINAADSNYDLGSARDVVTDGDGTGTPWKARLINDLWGFFQKLLNVGGITPSGSPDTIVASDYFAGLMTVVIRPVATVADMVALTDVRVGDVIKTKEFSNGNGGSGTYDIVLTSSVTPLPTGADGVDIIQSTVEPSISFVLRINEDVNVDQLAGSIGVDDTVMLNRAWALASTLKRNLTSSGGKAFVISSQVAGTFESIDVNFNGSIITVDTLIQSVPAVKFSVSKSINLKDFTVDGANLSHRPLEIFGTTDETSVITDNARAKNAFGVGAGSLQVNGIRVVGNGKSIKMTNTDIEGVDSDVGRSNTAGILAGRGATGTEGFLKVEIVNTTLKNITEQGGASTADSDGVKVIGYTGQGSTKKTDVVIRGVTLNNDSGLSIKRIVKTQCDTYDVSNITGNFSNCNVNAFVDNQFGSGTCDNVNIEADTVAISVSIVGLPQFTTGAENDAGSSATNINFAGTNCTAISLVTAFLTTDRELPRVLRNWKVVGVDYDNFGILETDNNNSILWCENINLTESTAQTDFAFLGTDVGTPTGVNIIKCVFINFRTDRVLKSIGLFSGDSTVWSRLMPTFVTNSMLQFTGHIGQSTNFIDRPTFSNGISTYKNKVPVGSSVGIGSTIIEINDDLNNTPFESILFTYKVSRLGNSTTNASFNVMFDTPTSTALIELVESAVGSNTLNTPTATFNSGNNQLEISWGTDSTAASGCTIKIESTVDFTVLKVFGLTSIV